jgi:hypothetical protein
VRAVVCFDGFIGVQNVARLERNVERFRTPSESYMRTHQRMLIALRSGVSSCQWFWGMKDVFLVLGKGPCARQLSVVP